VRIRCSKCKKALNVRDDLAGRKVRCPACGAAIRVPDGKKSPQPVGAGARRAKGPSTDTDAGRETASAAQSEAQGATGEDHLELELEPDISVQTEEPVKKKVGPSGEEPVFYLAKGNDKLGTTTTAWNRIEEVMADEGLTFEFIRQQAGPLGEPALRKDDMYFSAGVDHIEYGSRFVRAFVFPLNLLGLGAARLEVTAQLRDGKGTSTSFKVKARRACHWLFGGSDDRLIELNKKTVANKCALHMARHIKGKWLVNSAVYELGRLSAVLGGVGLIPGLGYLLGAPAAVLGLVSLGANLSRNLPKGKGVAALGVALGIADFVLSGLFWSPIVEAARNLFA